MQVPQVQVPQVQVPQVQESQVQESQVQEWVSGVRSPDPALRLPHPGCPESHSRYLLHPFCSVQPRSVFLPVLPAPLGYWFCHSSELRSHSSAPLPCPVLFPRLSVRPVHPLITSGTFRSEPWHHLRIGDNLHHSGLTESFYHNSSGSG